MYRLKTLTGHCVWAREVGSQATEVAIRADVLNLMTVLARPQSVRIALVQPHRGTPTSNSIYATTAR